MVINGNADYHTWAFSDSNGKNEGNYSLKNVTVYAVGENVS